MKSKILNIIFSSLLFSSLFFSSLLYPYQLNAKKVDPVNVKKVAINAFSNRSGIEKSKIEVSEIIPIQADGEIVYTIFNLKPQGHIVVSNTDIAEPVIGYGLTSHIDFENIPPAQEYLLDGYKNEIAEAKKHNVTANESIKNKWDNYLADYDGEILKSYSLGSCLLETNWGQQTTFNDSCPDDPVSEIQCVVGCGGVAIGQVLNYWGCLVFPDNSISYTPLRFSSPLSINLYDQDYDWDDIGTVPAANTQFLYHCALAIYSNFGDPDIGTSSNIDNIRYALLHSYGFNANQVDDKDSHIDSEWINMLKAEIDAERPVIYRGECDTCSKGHVWVVDGYDVYNKFHCNWGWLGSDNEFYSLSDLTPDDEDYTYDQYAIMGIEPVLDACSGLSGEDLICSANESYSVSIPSKASVVWSKSANLDQVGENTGTTYTVNEGSSGSGYVTATIKNSQGDTFLTRTKTIWAGAPVINSIDGPTSTPNNQWAYYTAELESELSDPTDYNWILNPLNGNSVYDYGHYCDIAFYNPGSYQLVVQAKNTCSDPNYGPYYVTGIYVYDSRSLSVSPNPSSGETTISIESSGEEALKSASTEDTFDQNAEWDLEVYDSMQNLKLKKQKLKGQSTTINTQSWKEGVYMVRVNYKEEILTGKLVVKK